MTTPVTHPTSDEIYFFATNGYLVLENFLQPDHVARLIERLEKAVAYRRRLHDNGEPHPGEIIIEGPNARILHILEDDPLFRDLVDHPPIMPYVCGLLNEKPHFHASDAFWEIEPAESKPGWHIDGFGGGYRSLRPQIPLLQLKVGYFLSDMSAPDQGNLILVPSSHKTDFDPDPEQLQGHDTFPGATPLCVPAGTCVMFHNALWHTKGPFTRPGGQRLMLYYAYEQPWMVANPEHWSYSKKFYNSLSPDQRQLFHGFVFDPPEHRWS
jgi:ectoine hydroxylase